MNDAHSAAPDTHAADRAGEPRPRPARSARLSLSWRRRDRQRRRRPLQRPPLDDARLHAERGEPDRAADRHELHRHRARRRHLLLQGHRRGRRRQRRRRLERGERPPSTATTRPPDAPRDVSRATAAPGQAALTWTRVDRQRRRHPLQRPPLDDDPASRPRPRNRIAQPTGTSYTDTGLARRHLLLQGHRRGRAGNVGAASNEATATVTGAPPAGLVAALRLRRGHRHDHRRPVRQRQQRHARERDLVDGGKYGNALSFNGTNDCVSASPTRTRSTSRPAMTLEALGAGRRRSAPAGGRSLLKEQAGNLVYGALREHRRRAGRRANASTAARIATARGTDAASPRTRGRTSPPRTTARRSRLYVNGDPGRRR